MRRFPPNGDFYDYAYSVAQVRDQLDEATFSAAYAVGRAMTLEQAIAYALEDGEADVGNERTVASSTNSG